MMFYQSYSSLEPRNTRINAPKIKKNVKCKINRYACKKMMHCAVRDAKNSQIIYVNKIK